MVIDPQTLELQSHEQRIVQEGQKVIKDKVKAEMHQAVVEVGTDICHDVDEAFVILRYCAAPFPTLPRSLGTAWPPRAPTRFAVAKQLITNHARYNQIVDELQDARAAT
jgi:carboxylate-amine ligase